MQPRDLARSPRALAGIVVWMAAVTYVVGTAVRARGGRAAPPDPWLTAAMVLLGAWLLVGVAMAHAQEAITRRALRRHPGLPVLTRDDLARAASRVDALWTRPAVRAAWRRLLWRSLNPLLAVGALAVAVALPLRSLRASDAQLETQGVQVLGHVIATGWAFAGRGGRPVVDVTYTYEGRTYSAAVAGPPPAALGHDAGLPLVIDPGLPQHVHAATFHDFSGWLDAWVSLCLLLGVLLTALAVRRTVAAVWWRRALRLGRAVPADAVVAGPYALLAPLGGGGGDGRRTVARTSPLVPGIGASSLPLPDDGRVALLPGRGHEVLSVWADGRLVPLELPHHAAQARRWLARMGAGAASTGAQSSVGAEAQAGAEPPALHA